MMTMMHTAGMNPGFSFFWLVHVLSVILFFSGLIFLIVWAIKTLPLSQLRTWAWGLLVAGTVLCLVAFMGLGGRAGWDARGGGRSAMMGGMMGTSPNGMGMMSNMGMMLEGLSGDAFDEAFIRMMIPHHEGAIDMAEAALESAEHEELKQLSRDIIAAQQREIDMMEGWLDAWGYDE